MKKAIHFGAGNIGRGFIGQHLHESGYEITFVDVNDQLVQDINTLGKYHIQIVGDQPQTLEVTGVKAINSNTHLEDLLNAFIDADIVTTAIGPSILKFIAPNIAKGLERRLTKTTKPLNIVACENMVGGSTVLKNFVYQSLPEDLKAKVDEYIGFPDAAVDRIVPVQHNEEKLLVQVEPYSEWDVDATKWKGEKQEINGMTYVDNLSAYIERKLFTVNTGHASIAYTAYQKGIKNIYDAMQDDEVVALARKVWHETGTLLIEKYGFDKDVHQKYIETTESRFRNPHLSDAVTRVGRGPKRKLGAKDRLVSPATQLIERGHKPEALAKVIAEALHFDYDGDKEAVEVQNYIKENGIEKAITHFTEVPEGSELYKMILANC